MKQYFISIINRYFYKNSRSFLSLLALVSLLFSLTGCDVPGLDPLINEIEKTRQTIENQSIGWREELPKLKKYLEGMESKVSADAQGIVADTANQVQDLATQTIQLSDAKAQDLIAQAGVEFRCNSDFVKAGVVAQLQFLADDLKFWKDHKEHLDKKPNHTVCWINPTVLSLYPSENNWLIDTSNMSGKNIVHVYGYNFWSDALPVLELQDASGQKLRNVNLAAAYVTHYQIDLDFSSENFTGVNPGARVVFSWPDYHDPNTISLTLNAPAKLKLNNPVFSPASPIVGIDPVRLQVTITNVGGSRSGDFVVTWKPDPSDNRTIWVSSLPLEPKEPKTVSFPEAYIFQKKGQLTMMISLNNGDDTLSVPLTVQQKPSQSIKREEFKGGEYYELGNINVLSCPVGYAMAGFHYHENKLLCRRVMAIGEEGSVVDVLDAGTARQGMHACPIGTYMRGLNLDSNKYLCSWDSDHGDHNEWPESSEFLDYNTNSPQWGLHICPRDGIPTYMTGYDTSNNRFLCGVHYREDQ